MEPVALMIRESSKWKPHEDQSTDAGHRGGALRSSDEAAVMAVERRECVVQRNKLVNQLGGTNESSKTV